MSQKMWISIGGLIGSTAGGFLPTLIGINDFFVLSMLGVLGGLLGLYLGYKFGE